MQDNRSTTPVADQPDEGRRSLLKGAAVAAAGLTVAPGVILVATAGSDSGSSDGATSRHRWGLLIDTRRCESGCDKCVAACSDENGVNDKRSRRDQQAQWIRKVELRDRSTGFSSSLPMMCQHCEHPPCVDVCPTGASMKRVDGIVLVDKHICIGCRYCMMACPYKARSFVHEPVSGQKEHAPRGMGTVESCTLCVHRVDEGRTTACAEACPNGAILFGDLNDPDSEISMRLRKEPSTQIRSDLGLNVGVRYQGI
jgi:tetrathionate reductase subunit B